LISAELGRAQRYELSMPMRYRPAHASQWQAGRTINISRSGALLEAESRCNAGTAIEFWMTFGTGMAELVGAGIVVRVDDRDRLALRFDFSQLQRSVPAQAGSPTRSSEPL
jgi:hypothetical protein